MLSNQQVFTKVFGNHILESPGTIFPPFQKEHEKHRGGNPKQPQRPEKDKS
jgi:hypothetical protein